MNSILTCHNIVTSVNTRCYLIPILTSIFVAILTGVVHNDTILYTMRYLCNISIVKCRLPLLNVSNPRLHARGVFSEVMIDIIFRNFTHLL